jgi:hypothetical protein
MGRFGGDTRGMKKIVISVFCLVSEENEFCPRATQKWHVAGMQINAKQGGNMG